MGQEILNLKGIESTFIKGYLFRDFLLHILYYRVPHATVSGQDQALCEHKILQKCHRSIKFIGNLKQFYNGLTV